MPQLTSWDMAMPTTIAACWKEPSRPRYAGGDTSAMYAGPITEAMPIAKPPTIRQNARSYRANGSAEPMALTRNSTAAICMQRIRPMRSAIRPAVAAPIAQPISAIAMTWASAADPMS